MLSIHLYHYTLRWCHNELDGVSDHQPHDCLLNCLFGCRSKETSKLRVTGLCAGIHRGPANSPHKRPVTRKMFPFDDVIMIRQDSATGAGAYDCPVPVTRPRKRSANRSQPNQRYCKALMMRIFFGKFFRWVLRESHIHVATEAKIDMVIPCTRISTL